ncbi:hypothetical protein RFI_21565 [Reticulomyxa filosa]|uniref:SET domain-containing protein n=1 Tax=Reticulomyxa filosa TaxID=46433 RepID=X6MP69_RETFI|nr:hypothetical protein RFI_21565 [Reticulomyxa filosa]|eukprot:ETO15798.1 hypothetical protein RFI_21565 [Reticulomyxa filosa]
MFAEVIFCLKNCKRYSEAMEYGKKALAVYRDSKHKACDLFLLQSVEEVMQLLQKIQAAEKIHMRIRDSKSFDDVEGFVHLCETYNLHFNSSRANIDTQQKFESLVRSYQSQRKAKAKLEQDYNLLKMRTEFELRLLKNENERLKAQIVELLANAQCLRSIVIYGDAPRRHKVNEAKPNFETGDNFKGSVSAHELRKFIKNIYSQQKKGCGGLLLSSICKKKKKKSLNMNENEITIKTREKTHKCYLENIKRFVKENGEYNENPQRCVIPCPNGTVRLVSCHDLIMAVTITNDPRIPSLNGENGVKAKMDIPIASVLVQYCGMEYLSTEFDEIYRDTTEQTSRNRYAFELAIEEKRILQRLEENDWTLNGCHYKQDLCSHENCTPTIRVGNQHLHFVIDGMGLNPCNDVTNLWCLFNDCRKNINVQTPTTDDLRFQNCEFVQVTVDGWTSVFVVTNKYVKKGEDLMLYYGQTYGESLVEHSQYVQNTKEKQQFIDMQMPRVCEPLWHHLLFLYVLYLIGVFANTFVLFTKFYLFNISC